MIKTLEKSLKNALRWPALQCLVLFTAKSAKDAKISSKGLVYYYNIGG